MQSAVGSVKHPQALTRSRGICRARHATAEALQREMQQVTERADNMHETTTEQVDDLSMQLANEQSARQAAELQLKAFQKPLEPLQHKLAAAADDANADAAFACAEHSGSSFTAQPS